MGQPLHIKNNAPERIYVEWWTAGSVFKITNYSIEPGQTVSHSEEAVWYDIYVIFDGIKYGKVVFYGGSEAWWSFDTNGINAGGPKLAAEVEPNLVYLNLKD